MADVNGIPDIQIVTGSPWRGVRYFCTTRHGGVSVGPLGQLNLGAHVGDDPAHVAENRRRLAALLPAAPLWLQQVHGKDVVDADMPSASEAIPVADASVTGMAGRVLAIMTADCLPVVLSDMDGRVLGAAHAGWRGLAAGVLENTLAHMRARHPRSRGWKAWIGPAIGQSAFEVGQDVLDAFAGLGPDAHRCFIPGAKPGKWLADLPGLASLRLKRAGVEQVECCGHCTYSEEGLFYSYRRDPRGGRMATLAWLETDPGAGA